MGRLLQTADGTIYGTSAGGGIGDKGTVFKISPTGQLTTLHKFTRADGESPQAGLTLGNDGDLYGTTSRGGTFGRGTVFKITTAGALTTLHSFSGPDGDRPNNELCLASDGNFYGTTANGGAFTTTLGQEGGVLFKMTPAGVVTTIRSFEVISAEGYHPTAFFEGSDGNFYGALRLGGRESPQHSYSTGTIFKMSMQTPPVLTVLHYFDGHPDEQGGGPLSLTETSAGTFYGTTFGGSVPGRDFDLGQGCGVIFKITAQGEYTLLHAFDGTDGTRSYGRLLEAADGYLYGVSDAGGISNYGTIYRIHPGSLPMRSSKSQVEREETQEASDEPVFTLLHSFIGGDGRTPGRGLIQAPDGKLYGTTQQGGAAAAGNGFAANIGLPPAPILNISTRLRVQGGDSVLIGGFIITGPEPKKVIVRGIGPSLGNAGVAGALENPKLRLHSGDGALLASNDDWKDSQRSEIEATTIPPGNDLEPAIVQTLSPGAYTAVLEEKNGRPGIGVVEIYDLSSGSGSKLANISTRGFVDTGDNVMIAGLIVGQNETSSAARVLLRGIGPSLANSGVTGALQNPTMELRNSQGSLVAGNDDWKETQRAQIQATTVPPADDRESAIVTGLMSGAYTVILRGKDGSTGVGLVELYALD